MINLKPPKTENTSIEELARYVYQLTDQLNWAFQTLERLIDEAKRESVIYENKRGE